jgi:DNA-binding NarL/FixJ family response regulator
MVRDSSIEENRHMAELSKGASFAGVAGWAELRASRWHAAREHFEQAVRDEETPSAWEGLSWAAWWLDDADAVFEARERAFRLYRDQSEPAAAARMAIWLACDELDFRGGVSAARGWLARGGRLLGPLEPVPEHGWLAFFEGYLAAAEGEGGRVLALAADAADIGARLGVPDLEMLGLALEGSALVRTGETTAGMRRLDEAAVVALTGEPALPISSAWACCFLVTACVASRDYARALEWCDRIADFAERHGSRYMLAFCRAEYGAVHLWKGRWKEAERLLAASVEDFSQSRPAMVGSALTGLAELRRRQGRAAEAADLLDRADPGADAILCRGRLALDAGDALQATDMAERVLRRVPQHGLERAPALELLVEARVALGRPEEARPAAGELRALAEGVGTPAVEAAANAAEAGLAAAAGEHERARTLLEDAVDGFERSGGRYEAARARVGLAASLLALGRAAAGRREAEAAAQTLLDLGANADVQRVRRFLPPAPGDPAPLPDLTSREREVLRLISAGLTNREIAERLVVSEHTVHRHVANILRRLGVPSRSAAAAHAARAGLLDRDDT